VSKLDELKARASAGDKRMPLSPVDAHLTLREHIQAGGKFRDHKVAMAVMRALNIRDEITDPEILAKAELKLYEILKADPIHGVEIERA
jgi:hypothetical protein